MGLRGAAIALLAALVGALLALPVMAGEATGEAVRGTIEQLGDPQSPEDDAPVEGVEIHVRTADGQDIGTARTGADGTFLLELPGPGDYTATIDESTLPEGVTLRNPDRATLEFTINPGQQRTLLYPLGEGTGGGTGRLAVLSQLVAQGIKFGLIIAMTAIGLSLIFGTTGLVNFAHGELVSFGALVAYFFNVVIGWQLIPATVVAVLLGALFRGPLDRGVFRPLRGRRTGLIALLVVSIGLSLLLRNLFLYVFGGRTRPFADYTVQPAIDLGPISLAPKDLAVMGLSILVLVCVGVALLKTRIGKAMRAVADNRDLAESSGIDVERVILYVWMFGGALAALGGVLYALDEQVSFQQGFQLLLLMFAGVILGGLGTAFGALVGSLVVGIMVQVSTLVLPVEMKNVTALAVLALVLLVRPQGLLGRPERVG